MPAGAPGHGDDAEAVLLAAVQLAPCVMVGGAFVAAVRQLDGGIADHPHSVVRSASVISVGQSWQTAAVSESTRRCEPGNSRASMCGTLCKLRHCTSAAGGNLRGVKYRTGSGFRARRQREEPDIHWNSRLFLALGDPRPFPTPLPEKATYYRLLAAGRCLQATSYKPGGRRPLGEDCVLGIVSRDLTLPATACPSADGGAEVLISTRNASSLRRISGTNSTSGHRTQSVGDLLLLGREQNVGRHLITSARSMWIWRSAAPTRSPDLSVLAISNQSLARDRYR